MKHNSLKWIIWDFNGTLMDDGWLGCDIENGMRIKRGMKPFTMEEYYELFDFPIRDYYTRTGYNFEIEPFEVLNNEFLSEYERRQTECPLRGDVEEVLAAARDMGLKQCVLSAMGHDRLIPLIRHYGIDGYFDAILGLENDHADGKVELGKRLLNDAGISPDEAVLFGDTTHDAQVASELGTRCVLLRGGHMGSGRIEATGSEVLDSPSDIKLWLERELAD